MLSDKNNNLFAYLGGVSSSLLLPLQFFFFNLFFSAVTFKTGITDTRLLIGQLTCQSLPAEIFLFFLANESHFMTQYVYF